MFLVEHMFLFLVEEMKVERRGTLREKILIDSYNGISAHPNYYEHYYLSIGFNPIGSKFGLVNCVDHQFVSESIQGAGVDL